MDPELKSLLQKVDQGDIEKIPMLADWLKTHGDSRAELAQQAATLNPHEIAEEMVKIRAMWQIEIRGRVRYWYSTQACLSEVEKAIETKKLPADVARAMTNARRIKVDRLLAAFQPNEQATPPSPPALN
jgi:hypothetical protein